MPTTGSTELGSSPTPFFTQCNDTIKAPFDPNLNTGSIFDYPQLDEGLEQIKYEGNLVVPGPNEKQGKI